MCRFLVYFGNEKILLADLITKPKHSIVQQSFCDPFLPFLSDSAKKTLKHYRVNGDGFGVAWYEDSDSFPCLFTSIKPSWNDMNLQRIAEHIRSSCVFSHVRAASPKSLIVENNCHPFQAGKILFMHNGCIAHFYKIKKRICSELNDYCFSLIRGTSDTEHAMAIFVSYLPGQDPSANHSGHVLKEAMLKTIHYILRITKECGEEPEASSLNFAVTNSQVVIATRFKNSVDEEPPSLYYTKSVRYECLSPRRSIECTAASLPIETIQECVGGGGGGFVKTSVVIASEPLNYNEDDWDLVKKNHLIIVTPSHKIKIEPIEVSEDLMVGNHSSSKKDDNSVKKSCSMEDFMFDFKNKNNQSNDSTIAITNSSKSSSSNQLVGSPVLKCGSVIIVDESNNSSNNVKDYQQYPTFYNRRRLSLSAPHNITELSLTKDFPLETFKIESVVASTIKTSPSSKVMKENDNIVVSKMNKDSLSSSLLLSPQNVIAATDKQKKEVIKIQLELSKDNILTMLTVIVALQILLIAYILNK